MCNKLSFMNIYIIIARVLQRSNKLQYLIKNYKTARMTDLTSNHITQTSRVAETGSEPALQ